MTSTTGTRVMSAATAAYAVYALAKPEHLPIQDVSGEPIAVPSVH